MENRSNIWAIIVIAISIISIAVSADASDSWVLWEKNEWTAVFDTGPRGDVYWTIIGADPQFGTCEKWKENVIKATKENKEKGAKENAAWSKQEVKRVGDTISVSYSRDSKKAGQIEWYLGDITYYCLPGTLDPREKKDQGNY